MDEVIAADRPEEPIHCLRPVTVAATARDFVQAFPGDVLYAVKCNPDPAVLRALWRGGVRHFDCASLPEIRLVRDMFPDAAIHFMHPIKARGAIREAWARHGVRDFVLDSADELAKIRTEIAATGVTGTLGLIVRIALPKGAAKLDLSGKFGADFDTAVALLRAARGRARNARCQLPCRFAVPRSAGLARRAGADRAGDPRGRGEGRCHRCRRRVSGRVPGPGAAAAGRLLRRDRGRLRATRPARRPPVGGARPSAGRRRDIGCGAGAGPARGEALYVNDGVYGSLADAGTLGFRYPVRLIRPDAGAATETIAFSLFGPTCDSADVMRGPFLLPADTSEGDWIEIGQLGAYGACLRTAFNGFDRARIVEVADKPMLKTPSHHAGSLRVAA